MNKVISELLSNSVNDDRNEVQQFIKDLNSFTNNKFNESLTKLVYDTGKRNITDDITIERDYDLDATNEMVMDICNLFVKYKDKFKIDIEVKGEKLNSTDNTKQHAMIERIASVLGVINTGFTIRTFKEEFDKFAKESNQNIDEKEYKTLLLRFMLSNISSISAQFNSLGEVLVYTSKEALMDFVQADETRKVQ